MTKDWSGNTNIHIINHRNKEEEVAQHDFYATDPKMANWLLKLEPQLNNIWEPAAGQGHLAKEFDKVGKLGKATDLYNYGYCDSDVNFLECNEKWDGDIVTNPPYNKSQEFAERALGLIDKGHYVCMFLKLTFLEGKKRKKFFKDFPPIRVWVSTSRVMCAKNGDFNQKDSSAVCYGWFIWEKGFQGSPSIGWFN